MAAVTPIGQHLKIVAAVGRRLRRRFAAAIQTSKKSIKQDQLIESSTKKCSNENKCLNDRQICNYYEE
uniref:Uncharacterized protein n=1 Tax=Romanomermis culicivorax TaxID=13658 RepID=A0A915KLH8_ROMCU